MDIAKHRRDEEPDARLGQRTPNHGSPPPKHANLPAPTYDLAQCLPTGATRYGDKAYHSGEDEAWLDGEWGVRLVPICQKNMTPNSEPERNVLRHQRAVIEGVNSPLAAWGVQRLHARTSEGFAIKLLASLLALVVVNAR